MGLTGVPLTLTSKCRCGPVAYPVLPTVPILWPFLTFWPTETLMPPDGWCASGETVLLVEDEPAMLRLGQAMLERITNAMLDARAALWREFEQLHREMLRIVRDDEICRRLMSIPGVGPLVAVGAARAALMRCANHAARLLHRQ